MHAARIGRVVEEDELPAGGRVSRKIVLQKLVIPLPRRIAMGTVAFQNDEVGLAGIEGIVPVRHEKVLDARGALLRCVVVISEHPNDAVGVQEIGVLRKDVLIHLRQGASFIGVVPERYEQVWVLLLHQVHDFNLSCRGTAEVSGRGETDRAAVRQAAEMSVSGLTA